MVALILTPTISIGLDKGEHVRGDDLLQALAKNAAGHLRAAADGGDMEALSGLFREIRVVSACLENADLPVHIDVLEHIKTQDEIWTRENQRAADRQGWNIFDADGSSHGRWQLQRIDCPDDGSQPRFESDADAAAFVKRQAEHGDPLAIKAIGMLVFVGSEDVERFKLDKFNIPPVKEKT